MLDINTLKNSLPLFQHRIDELLTLIGLDLTPYKADHIALRVNQFAIAKQLHIAWQEEGDIISDNMINGRPIVVVKLANPLTLSHWQIDCVELPYPNDKHYPEEGWEHVEWVIPSRAETTEAFLQDVFRLFPLIRSQWNRLAALGVKVKASAPKGEGERLANPTIAFKANGVCIKLHPVSLEDVAKSEKCKL